MEESATHPSLFVVLQVWVCLGKKLQPPVNRLPSFRRNDSYRSA